MPLHNLFSLICMMLTQIRNGFMLLSDTVSFSVLLGSLIGEKKSILERKKR